MDIRKTIIDKYNIRKREKLEKRETLKKKTEIFQSIYNTLKTWEHVDKNFDNDYVCASEELIYSLENIFNDSFVILKNPKEKEVNIVDVDKVVHLFENRDWEITHAIKTFHQYAKEIVNDKNYLSKFRLENFDKNIKEAIDEMNIREKTNDKQLLFYYQNWNQKLVLSNRNGTHRFAFAVGYCILKQEQYWVNGLLYQKVLNINKLLSTLDKYSIFAITGKPNIGKNEKGLKGTEVQLDKKRNEKAQEQETTLYALFQNFYPFGKTFDNARKDNIKITNDFIVIKNHLTNDAEKSILKIVKSFPSIFYPFNEFIKEKYLI